MKATGTTVLDWLSDLAAGGQRFERLEAEGKRRLSRRVRVLQKELQRLQGEQIKLEEETEDRIRELTRTDAPKVQSSVEASIVSLQKRTQENSDKRLFASLILDETHIKTALSGVYRTGPDSSAIAPAPPDRLEWTSIEVVAMNSRLAKFRY